MLSHPAALWDTVRSSVSTTGHPPPAACDRRPAFVCVCACPVATVGILKWLFGERQTYQRVVCQQSLWQASAFEKCIFLHNFRRTQSCAESGRSAPGQVDVIFMLERLSVCLQILKHAVGPTRGGGLKLNMQLRQPHSMTTGGTICMLHVLLHLT